MEASGRSRDRITRVVADGLLISVEAVLNHERVLVSYTTTRKQLRDRVRRREAATLDLEHEILQVVGAHTRHA